MYKKIINLVSGDTGLLLRFQIRDSTVSVAEDILAIQDRPETWKPIDLTTVTVTLEYVGLDNNMYSIGSTATAQEKTLGIVAIPLDDITAAAGDIQGEVLLVDGGSQYTIFDKFLFVVRDTLAGEVSNLVV